MISLFIDTSNQHLIISIYKNDNVIGYCDEKSDNDLSVKLLPYIDNMLSKNNMKIDDIDNIFVVNGPGSFTGIRIGVTTAKTIAWGKNKKINTISELELLSSIETNKKYIVPLIDARRGYVYTAMYDKNGNNIINDSYQELEKFYTELRNNYDICDIEFVSYDEFELPTIKPCIDVLKVLKRHMNEPGMNPHKVNPNYLKLTEAEEKLNDKRNNS